MSRPAWFVHHTPIATSMNMPTYHHAFASEAEAQTFAAGLDGRTVVFSGWVED